MAKSTRKCGICGKDIVISRQNLENIAFYQGRHNHLECLVNKANQGLASGKRVTCWEKLRNRIPEFQAESKAKLEHSIIRDEFNDYLLDNYDVVSVPNRFWLTVEEIGNGLYNKKKCRPTDMETILGTWKWGQGHLDKIAVTNKTQHRGPSNDDQRLNYDLAIVLKHIGDYEKHITSTKEEIAVVEECIEKQNKINYEALYNQSKNNQNTNDILDLMNDIF